MKHFEEQQLTSDILIAGGGPTGVACALSASRQGRSVILCQDRPVLGGNASSEVRMHIVGANSFRKTKDLHLEPRESGIIEEIRLENAVRNPQRSAAFFDLILLEKCRAEPNLQLLLNTSVVAASSENRRVTEAKAIRASTEDIFHIRSQVFIDCTGDGGLAAAAGAAFMSGREDHEAHGESFAQEKADDKCLGSTLLFMGKKFDRPMPFIAPAWARKFTEEDFKLRSLDTFEYGYWWIEWGGQLDTIKDNENIRDELLAIVMGVWDHVKNSGKHPQSENWALDWFGFLPGKRESRRFIGQHILTQSDLQNSVPFSDTIAYGGWPIDLHPPEGIDRPDEHPCIQHKLPWLYDIPLRACIARDFDNLLFGGRNLSATHVAFASTRVMATCAAVGEGIGVAASLACEKKIPVASLPGNPDLMTEIQDRLLKQDVFLIARKPSHENLAWPAKVTASGETPDGPAQNVLSGINRAIHADLPEDRRQPGTHRWISEAKLPAWLRLDWPEAIAAKEVRITFDTGLHRYLTLTQSDSYHAFMTWEQGQPETVRHYRVEIQKDQKWQQLTEEKNNWQRLRYHPIPKELQEGIQAIRITVESTWGIDHARIVSLAVYG